MKKWAALFLILCSLGAFVSLFAGARYLAWSLPGGLPLGNALAVIGLCSAAGAALVSSLSQSLLRWLSAFALVLSLAWLPLSIALAGNLMLNSEENQGVIWMWISSITGVLALILLSCSILRIFSAKGTDETSPPVI